MKKKYKICLFPFIIISLVFFLLVSCKKEKPTVLTTSDITKITQTSATCGGNITDDGKADITARGVCWSTTQNPTISDNKTNDGDGEGEFISDITGLTANTTYYIRAYATNREGTSYGNQVILKTYTCTMTDIDGNIYNTITIGTQVWMAENLRVSRYSNGTPIFCLSDSAQWADAQIGAYCWYFNDSAAYNIPYGKLYNWLAVTNSNKLAPIGWHIPSDAEWAILISFLGDHVAEKLKESGTIHWTSPNSGTNESGFTALPCGHRTIHGQFFEIGYSSDFWTSSVYYAYLAWAMGIWLNESDVKKYNVYISEGFPVRCIKD